MADLYAVAGQRYFIGSAAVDLPGRDLLPADFDTVDWIEIKNWQTMGAIGDAAALITTPLIDQQRDVKQKGTRNAGSMQNNFGLNLGDPGQQALMAAEKTDLNYPFRILGNDEPSAGSAPTPSQRLFYGLVMSAQEQGGGANTAQLLSSTVEINSNIVIVPPSTGAAPVNVTLPAISGIAQEDETLYCWEGVWTGGVDEFLYQWKNSGVDIPGADGPTYTPVSGDVGDVITCEVTARNSAGDTTVVTAPTAEVLAA